jgi:NADPH:quinone reductase-like Zn-dependent oxidoreductase
VVQDGAWRAAVAGGWAWEGSTVKAMVYRRFGSPDVLELQDVDQPALTDDGVLVRVHASSVNPAEWYAVTGRPYVARAAMGLRRPKQPVPGVDFAGTVAAVGSAVTGFRPGDAVFGGTGGGAFAEYLCVRRAVVPKPANLTFEEAAAVPTAAVTALQGLRDRGQLRAGQTVLINGASGGVGTFAVQLAKAFGAEVTGVCSTRNLDLVSSLGADHVVDHAREDFTRNGRRYDLLLDVAGNRSWSDCRRVLGRGATLVLVGGPKTNRWIGPLAHIASVRVASLGGGRKVVFFVAQFNRQDFVVLRDLLEAGAVRSVIDRSYQLSQLPEALDYLGEGHARGKVVITL